MSPFTQLTEIIDDALTKRIGSGLQARLVVDGRTQFAIDLGRLAHNHDEPVTPATWFDLASLTKPLVVGTILARWVTQGRVALTDELGDYLPEWTQAKKPAVTLRQCLQHLTGLPAWKPYYESIGDSADARMALLQAICATELENEPGTVCTYSDLDYILLGFALERIGDKRLDALFAEEVAGPLGIAELRFLPIGDDDADNLRREIPIAATEICPRRGLLRGQVHDDNAFAAGGVCGHAGLFGTADAVARLALVWRDAIRGDSDFIAKAVAYDVIYPTDTPPRCDFALGWDRPTWKKSDTGRYIGADAIGHWGFTGTSLWIDHQRDVISVLLTNRVHPSRDDTRHKGLRRRFHEAAYTALGRTKPGPYRTPPAPDATEHIHLIAVAGTGMGSLAGMLKHAGYRVTGSDQAVYPPMSDILAAQKIEVRQPFGDANLADEPDLVVVGNVCSRDHVEAVAAKRRDLHVDSFPGVLERYFLATKTPLVVAGTHGKTTTSAMLAWLLEHGGFEPGFMIGGLVQNFGANFKLGAGDFFVVEGDEYDSAYFDKFPKFLHYRPHGAIITSIEYDHADIYDSLEEIVARFEDFVRLIPPDGALAACWDYETVRAVSRHARCKVLSYGAHPDAVWRWEVINDGAGETTFDVLESGTVRARITLPMNGAHNLANATAAAALLISQGVPAEKLPEAFAGFAGIARRQQLRGTPGGVYVIDDFAHHPTAVLTTLEGLRRSYPAGRLLVAFDPRTNTSSRNVFQARFAEVFDAADRLWIGNPSRMDRIPPEQRLDVAKLARDIAARGTEATHQPDIDAMAAEICASARPGDCVALLSNGAFGGLHAKLLSGLGDKADQA